RRHPRFSRDWRSDVCSSDLRTPRHARDRDRGDRARRVHARTRRNVLAVPVVPHFPPEEPVAMNQPQETYALALENLRRRQQDNGAFAGEVIWNPMLPCQYVIVCHIIGHEIPADRRARLRLHFERSVTPEGGWGMHPGGAPWMFHTALVYVALR